MGLKHAVMYNRTLYQDVGDYSHIITYVAWNHDVGYIVGQPYKASAISFSVSPRALVTCSKHILTPVMTHALDWRCSQDRIRRHLFLAN